MTDDNQIRTSLEGLSFNGFAGVTETLLSAFGIGEVTIKKITERIRKGEGGPFYVYRRAILFCTDGDDYRELSAPVIGSVPLVIVFQPNYIYINSTYKGEKLTQYYELAEMFDYLRPLTSWDVGRKDHYSTLELDELVESIYRSLMLNENTNGANARAAVYDLLYTSYFMSLLDLQEVKDILNRRAGDEEKLRAILEIAWGWNVFYVGQSWKSIHPSKETLKYALAILGFDMLHIDAEILTSLIYKMTGADEVGIYGHKTSFVYVEKVLQPLFLDKLQKRLEHSGIENVYKVVNDIYHTIIFDPTNSPGCFLTASYNGLIQLLRDAEERFGIILEIPLDISQFIAVVTNAITEELTRLSLTFTHLNELKRLGNIDFDTIRKVNRSLHIIHSEPLSSDWNEYISPGANTYIVGTPLFKGGHKVDVNQKTQMQGVFGSDKLYNADYCSAWLVKSAQFIKDSATRAAFVLTNSVSQGEQSSFIYNKVLEQGCEYYFGYRSFKWNAAKGDNVGVTVIIIGIEQKGQTKDKFVYFDGNRVKCTEIGSHLLPDIDIQVKSQEWILSSSVLPKMRKGNMPYCADALIFDTEGMEAFVERNPMAKKYIRALYGSQEFVRSTPRWCLWISDKELKEAIKIEEIAERIEQVREKRLGTSASADCKANPHKFREQFCTSKGKISIFVPTVTSENRFYFQMGIIDERTIANNNAFVVYDCDIWLLALLESRMHMIWTKNACGGHESRPRYSNTLCYNTFPVPEIDKKQKSILSSLARLLLQTREKYCDRSIGQMYKNMPPELVQIHELIDRKVDSLYQSQPFESDRDRLLMLKNLYNKLMAKAK